MNKKSYEEDGEGSVSITSESSQIQELGHYDSIGDKLLRPLSLLAT
jgi:hypothetical protein